MGRAPDRIAPRGAGGGLGSGADLGAGRCLLVLRRPARGAQDPVARHAGDRENHDLRAHAHDWNTSIAPRSSRSSPSARALSLWPRPEHPAPDHTADYPKELPVISLPLRTTTVMSSPRAYREKRRYW